MGGMVPILTGKSPWNPHGNCWEIIEMFSNVFWGWENFPFEHWGLVSQIYGIIKYCASHWIPTQSLLNPQSCWFYISPFCHFISGLLNYIRPQLFNGWAHKYDRGNALPSIIHQVDDIHVPITSPLWLAYIHDIPNSTCSNLVFNPHVQWFLMVKLSTWWQIPYFFMVNHLSNHSKFPFFIVNPHFWISIVITHHEAP